MFLERRFDQPVAGPALAPVPGDAESIAKSRGALSFFTTPLSQTFFPPPPPLLPNVEWGPWWASEAGADASWVPVSTAGPSSDLSVELLRVAWADVGDVLDGEHDMEWTPRDDQIVAAVRSLAEGWEKDGPAGARCVRHLADHDGVAVPAGPCYLLTPHESSIPGTTALSELWYPTDGDSAVTSQEVYHGLIVPFHKPSNSSAFASAWRSSLADALAPLGAEVFTETYTGGKNVQCSTLVSVSGLFWPPSPSCLPSDNNCDWLLSLTLMADFCLSFRLRLVRAHQWSSHRPHHTLCWLATPSSSRPCSCSSQAPPKSTRASVSRLPALSNCAARASCPLAFSHCVAGTAGA